MARRIQPGIAANSRPSSTKRMPTPMRKSANAMDFIRLQLPTVRALHVSRRRAGTRFVAASLDERGRRRKTGAPPARPAERRLRLRRGVAFGLGRVGGRLPGRVPEVAEE